MSNRILSYKGLLTDGGQDTILLSTKKGEVGYRIKKFNIISTTPGASADESVIQIWKDSQAAASSTIDFSDNRLLGVGYWSAATSSGSPASMNIIFDQEIFNQDIYITHLNASTASDKPCNYYLELEAIKLDESQAMVATLKDIRNNS